MATTLDRPATPPQPATPPRSEPAGGATSARLGPTVPLTRKPSRDWRQHLWIGGVALIGLMGFLGPVISGMQITGNVSRAQAAPAAAAPASSLPAAVTITASEFKFSPASVQVPMGKKVTVTLNNTGSIEHDATVQAAGFSLLARAGQSATGEFTFTKPGTYELICSVPGHKDAGMKGTLVVVDPAAPTTTPAAQSAAPATTGMADHDMVATGATSAANIQPLPAGLKPLPQPVVAPPITRTEPALVRFNLETRKVVAQLADGVAYEYWTFDGTVPGPMLRVREGDTVELTLSNAADAGVTHSIDLHAVTGPGGGARVTQVAPGDTASFRFQAINPGVYVYHCATPMVASHIASGMYGLIVVEPKEGLPRVDHEYYVMEGDFYLQGQRGDQGLRAFDLNKMLDERPDYVLFNGGVGALTGDQALHARVGETVRFFFGVGGPNLTSSFHLIGEIFDRVFPEGASEVQHNVQTTLVPAGGATMVELTTQVPGTYTLVDHSLGRMEKGAAGQLVVDGDANPAVFETLQAGGGGTGGH